MPNNEMLQNMKLNNFQKWVDGIYETDRGFYLSMTYDDMFIFYNMQCDLDGKKALKIEPSEINFIIRQALYKK